MGARGVSPARVARRWPLPVILAALALAKAAALLVFVSGFLLTRVELPHRSRCGDVNVSTVIAAVGSRGEGEAEVVGSNPGGGGGCWLDASPVDKAVLLVIDGARFDFAAPASRPLGTPGDSTREGADASWRSPLSRGGRTPGEHEAESMSTRVDTAPPRSARLGSIAELIEADQAAGGVGASALFRFVADPPTTTQQRLKGLLTGGLPTFVDVRHSFSGATALTEDNVIGQAASAGRRVAMSGDDTWLELFRPAHFAAGVEPYPSFNVRDLDTVDDGVSASLARPGGWDVLIGHFLGVDHAGHTYGVDSQAMARKLDENDADIRAVVSAMAADPAYDRTILIVMGDHGMTLRGDHGGGTPDETDSFLFAHHPRAAAAAAAAVAEEASENDLDAHAQTTKSTRRATSPEDIETMPQVDFAPTLSLLLGLPVPFGSLGTVPRRLWDVAHAGGRVRSEGGGHVDERYARALEAVAAQVRRYLVEYAAAAGTPFNAADWTALEDLYERVEEAKKTHNNVGDRDDASGTKRMRGEDGAPAAEEEEEEEAALKARVRSCERFLRAAAETARGQWTTFDGERMTLGLVSLVLSLALHGYVLWSHIRDSPGASRRGEAWRAGSETFLSETNGYRERLLETLMVAVVSAAGATARLSNSFVVAEGDVTHFLLATIAAGLTVRALSRAGGEQEGTRRLSNHIPTASHKGPFFAAVGLLACNAALQALGSSWVKEGGGGGAGDASASSGGISDGSGVGGCIWDDGLPAGISLAALAAVPWVCHRALAGVGQQSDDEGRRRRRPRVPERVVRVAGAAAMAAGGARALAMGEAAKAAARASTVVGAVLDAAAAGAFPWIVYAGTVCALVATAACTGVKSSGRPTTRESARSSPRCHGETYVASVAHDAAWATMPTLVMLSGVRGALWGLLAVTQLGCAVRAATSCFSPVREDGRGVEKGGKDARPSLAAEATLACAWHVISAQLFFAGGHTCAFDGLHFACAFVGFKTFDFFRSGVLLAANTWSGDILACALLPAAATAFVSVSRTRKRVSRAEGHVSRSNDVVYGDAGECLETLEALFRACVTRVALWYSLMRSVGLLASTACVALMRRHLMVWAIFAPKFAFEAIGFVVVETLLVLSTGLALGASEPRRVASRIQSGCT